MRFSVIIPTLNEASELRATLASIPRTSDIEIVVVDGGSIDGTRQIAGETAVVVHSRQGRWCQMNEGASVANGDVLLFLHADSRLPAEAFSAIWSCLGNAAVVGGAFRLSIDSREMSLWLIAWVANLRSWAMRLLYGDQALFIRREVFQRMHGYADLPIMEDVDLVRRMRLEGRVELLDATVTTSARRWQVNGVIRTTTTNWAMMCLYLFGVSPYRLRRFYDRVLARN